MSDGAGVVATAKARRARKRKTRATTAANNNATATAAPGNIKTGITNTDNTKTGAPARRAAHSSTAKQVRYTLSSPEWHYIHLALHQHPGTSPPEPELELDALTLRRHLLGALSALLGEHGAAIPVDVLHIPKRSEHSERTEHSERPERGENGRRSEHSERSKTSKKSPTPPQSAIIRIHARDAQAVQAAISASGAAAGPAGVVAMRVVAEGSWLAPLVAGARGPVGTRSRAGADLFVFERSDGAVEAGTGAGTGGVGSVDVEAEGAQGPQGPRGGMELELG